MGWPFGEGSASTEAVADLFLVGLDLFLVGLAEARFAEGAVFFRIVLLAF